MAIVTRRLSGTVWRIVETQEDAATREITGSARAQSRLEELLDANKPAYLPGTEGLHYLLKTPFRYPPLRHGSRFGVATEPGIFYGSRELSTAQTESAVYLWLFRAALHDPGPLAVIRDSRTAFQVKVASRQAVDLTAPAFAAQRAELADPASYVASQAMGSALREQGVGFAWFHSARCAGGRNVAVFDPAAFAPAVRLQQEHWQLRLDAESCWWGHAEKADFEVRFAAVSVAGRIPHPAL